VNKKKPVNLNFLTLKFPINAAVSILHRMSGFFLFIALPILLWGLGKSLHSSADFTFVAACLSHPIAKIFLWVILTALAYHLIAGIRHLVMDWGYGDTLAGSRIGAKLVLSVFVIIAILLGVWTW
jgi:succinate dehydrogenase / fumarate reductase, cytochrome b subunit